VKRRGEKRKGRGGERRGDESRIGEGELVLCPRKKKSRRLWVCPSVCLSHWPAAGRVAANATSAAFSAYVDSGTQTCVLLLSCSRCFDGRQNL